MIPLDEIDELIFMFDTLEASYCRQFLIKENNSNMCMENIMGK